MQPQAMRDPVNCAAPFFIVLLRVGLMLSLMSIGTGSGSGFGKVLEPIMRIELLESPLLVSPLHAH